MRSWPIRVQIWVSIVSLILNWSIKPFFTYFLSKSKQSEWFYFAIQTFQKRYPFDKQTVDSRNNTHSIGNQRRRNVIEQSIRFAIQWHQHAACIGRLGYSGFDFVSISCLDDISRMYTDGQRQMDHVDKQEQTNLRTNQARVSLQSTWRRQWARECRSSVVWRWWQHLEKILWPHWVEVSYHTRCHSFVSLSSLSNSKMIVKVEIYFSLLEMSIPNFFPFRVQKTWS